MRPCRFAICDKPLMAALGPRRSSLVLSITAFVVAVVVLSSPAADSIGQKEYKDEINWNFVQPGSRNEIS